MTCNAHFRTWLIFFSQKPCVKIWFGLVEPFKCYCGNIQKKRKKKEKRSQLQLKLICVGKILFRALNKGIVENIIVLNLRM